MSILTGPSQAQVDKLVATFRYVPLAPGRLGVTTWMARTFAISLTTLQSDGLVEIIVKDRLAASVHHFKLGKRTLWDTPLAAECLDTLASHSKHITTDVAEKVSLTSLRSSAFSKLIRKQEKHISTSVTGLSQWQIDKVLAAFRHVPIPPTRTAIVIYMTGEFAISLSALETSKLMEDITKDRLAATVPAFLLVNKQEVAAVSACELPSLKLFYQATPKPAVLDVQKPFTASLDPFTVGNFLKKS